MYNAFGTPKELLEELRKYSNDYLTEKELLLLKERKKLDHTKDPEEISKIRQTVFKIVEGLNNDLKKVEEMNKVFNNEPTVSKISFFSGMDQDGHLEEALKEFKIIITKTKKVILLGKIIRDYIHKKAESSTK